LSPLLRRGARKKNPRRSQLAQPATIPGDTDRLQVCATNGAAGYFGGSIRCALRSLGAHLESTTKVRRKRTPVAELESSANPQAGRLRYVAHALPRAGTGAFPAARRW